MSNTLIQIKRSISTATPPGGSLAIGEQAYSYTSNTLFIGAPDGIGILAVGGKFYVDATIAAFAQANAAYNAANTGPTVAAAFTTANNAFAVSNNAYNKANTANVTADGAFLQANLAFAVGNAAYDKANTANITADLAFTHANNAYAKANAALSQAGGTITGDLAVQGNATFSGLVTYANTQTLLIGDNIFVLNADLPPAVAPSENAGFTVNRGSSANVDLLWNEATDTWTFQRTDGKYYDFVGNTELQSTNAIAVGAFTQGNTALTHANSAFAAANGAYAQANAGYAFANASGATANVAFNAANASYEYANAAGATANLGFAHANLAFAQANAASAQAANADFLTGGTVASARISGSYTGITGVGTIGTGIWQGSTVAVAYGGTGQTTFTTNGMLYGNGTGGLGVTAAGTEGQVLQASATGVPQFGMLDGGTF